MPKMKCKICNKEFYVKPSHQKIGYGQFCSRACHFKNQRRGKYVLCAACEKEIWRMPKELRKSKSNKFFCGKSCQTKWRNKQFSGIKHPNWRGGEHTYPRLMKEYGVQPICKHCGIKDRRVLIIHHLDHDRKHNTKDNLTWLCRNCHYLIHDGKTC